MNIRAHER